MNKRTATSVLIAMGMLATACASAVDDEPTQAGASPLRRSDDDLADPPLERAPIDPVEPPVTPPPPPLDHLVQGRLVRISSAELDQALIDALQGTRIVLDTTGKSTPILGAPVYSCWYPNQQAREQGQQECRDMYSGNALIQCMRMVNEDFPNIKECASQRPPRHSYIDFGAPAESLGAVDKTFDDFGPIYRDTTGPGGITVNVNFVRTTVNVGTTSAFLSAGPSGRATANLSLTFMSDQATLLCSHSSIFLGCPDLELTDMRIVTQLVGLAPVADNPALLGFDAAQASFTFHRNLNNIPDWLVTPFVDIDGAIRSKVEGYIEDAIGSAAAKAALQKALTGVVSSKIPGGYRRFYDAWFEDEQLVVDYQPCSRLGCVLPPLPPIEYAQ